MYHIGKSYNAILSLGLLVWWYWIDAWCISVWTFLLGYAARYNWPKCLNKLLMLICIYDCCQCKNCFLCKKRNFWNLSTTL